MSCSSVFIWNNPAKMSHLHMNSSSDLTLLRKGRSFTSFLHFRNRVCFCRPPRRLWWAALCKVLPDCGLCRASVTPLIGCSCAAAMIPGPSKLQSSFFLKLEFFMFIPVLAWRLNTYCGKKVIDLLFSALGTQHQIKL